jgi:hypothetical protein
MGGFLFPQDNQQHLHQHQYQALPVLYQRIVLWDRGKTGILVWVVKLGIKFKVLPHVEN